MKPKRNIVELFDNVKARDNYLRVCAPMVRYSKVQFRTLVKNYDVDLSFSPMILADSFCQNEKARSSEFATTMNDSPLVVQFAANNVNDFVDAAKMVSPYADGVDLNCGCPQRWAMKDGYGCALLSKPELVHNLVKEVKNSLPHSFNVSVKIRLLKDLKRTIDMCQKLEKCGVSFLTVHGRTPAQKSSGPIDFKALREVCQSVSIPVIANGGVKSLSDADTMYETVGCSGVMAASGLLTNPALFSGCNRTPVDCIRLWMKLKDKNPEQIAFQTYHHHLVFMLEKILNKTEKQAFNILGTFESVDEYIWKNVLGPVNGEMDFKYDMDEFVVCDYPEEITLKHCTKCRGCGKSIHYCICVKYDPSATDGNFFSSFVKDTDSLDYMDFNIFDETN